MRHGFKAEAERIALEVRAELGIDIEGRLDPFTLAEYLAIPVLTMRDVAERARTSTFYTFFSEVDPDSFSAITVFVGYKRLIVHNEHHHAHRQASNIAHEISHTLLEHKPVLTRARNGQRHWDAEMEQEATWLGAALLVPREGALLMARTGLGTAHIAKHYGVSESLCNWRITHTGIPQQIARGQRWCG